MVGSTIRDRTRLITYSHEGQISLFYHTETIRSRPTMSSTHRESDHSRSDEQSYEERLRRVRSRREKEQKTGFFARLTRRGKRARSFFSDGIWRLREGDVKGVQKSLVRILQVIVITIKEYTDSALGRKASALTYTTLLALIPMLAVILSIAAGFGMQSSVQRQLYDYFPGHYTELTQAFDFVESYMNVVHSNTFIIIGVGTLLYTVVRLMLSIEDVFNEVWHIKEPRPYSRRILGSVASFLILPFLITMTSGLNVFIRSFSSIKLFGGLSLSPVLSFFGNFGIYLIWILIFTSLYKFMPNTRVRLGPALIAGSLSGIVFQIFQMIYISGQLWVSKYNAIYGSFAAVPLLLLFVQMSWVIVLFGAQLAYSIQNVKFYFFRSESEHISRRFRDFIAVVLMKKICLAFKHEGDIYDGEALAKECDLPIIVVNDTLDKLVLCKLLIRQPNPKQTSRPTYIPALDVSTITVRKVTTAMDRLGAENFRIDLYDKYAKEWLIVRDARFSENPETMDQLVISL